MKRAAAAAVFLMILSTAKTISAQAGAAPAPATWRTQWVAQSREPFAEPVVTSRTLPRTLSIDALTDTEIQAIRREVYDSIKNEPRVDPTRHVSAADGCMQWVFQRWGPDQRWRAVGFRVGRGQGLIKLNGALRRVGLDYTINYDLNALIVRGRAIVETKRGGATIYTFAPHSSYAQARASAAADGALQDAIRGGEHGSRARELRFGSTDDIRIVERNAACSLLKARCRRYEFKATRAAFWSGYRTLEAPEGAAVREPVAAITGAPMEFAVEDMCPFAQAALIERQYSRAGGAPPIVKRFGLRGNAALRDALKPYVQ